MKKKPLLWLMVFLLAASLLTGCGGSAKGADSAAGPATQAAPMDYWDASSAEVAEESLADSGAGTDIPSLPQQDAKIIYSAELDLETTDFDGAVQALADLTAQLGGYYESSSLSNGGSYRSGSYTVRVPAENYRAFLDRAGEACHLLSLYEYADDVSEVYYDTAGRLQTQQAKLERLQELLGRAESMEDIIAIESALAETEETIDRLTGEIGHYDALVAYSTVNVYLREVYRHSNVEEPAQGFGSRLLAALRSGLNGFIAGMENIAVALAYGWLWLLLAAVIALIVILLVRRGAKRRARARAERAAASAAPVYTVPQEKKDP